IASQNSTVPLAASSTNGATKIAARGPVAGSPSPMMLSWPAAQVLIWAETKVATQAPQPKVISQTQKRCGRNRSAHRNSSDSGIAVTAAYFAAIGTASVPSPGSVPPGTSWSGTVCWYSSTSSVAYTPSMTTVTQN